jgi:hypothetical protein
MRRQHPDIIVPDLRRPAGAVIDAAGKVLCIACGMRLPIARADVVGLGYRCGSCSGAAQIAELDRREADLAANLTPSEQARLPRLLTGPQLILLGVGALVLAVVLWIATVGVPLLRGIPAPVWAGIAGSGMIAIGLTRIRGWKRRLVVPTE